jgi:hypothetical protein
MVKNYKLESFLMKLEENVAIKYFCNVEDMGESIFESFPWLTLQFINNNNNVPNKWIAS